ncbi:MFS transporter [Chromobacterium vaccinii]|nr:MFS transporter [Chromobacterium vaccinii]
MSLVLKRFRSLGAAFACMWLSEMITGLGSLLLQFALGVWIYQKTGSVEDFSFALLTGTLPAFLLLPIAGACADLLDRRKVLIACDFLLLLLIGVLSFMIWLDALLVPAAMAMNGLVALIHLFRRPSYQVALSRLLPVNQLSQANGLRTLSDGLVQLAGPMLAGALMFQFGLTGILPLETLLIAAAVLLVLRAMRGATEPAAAGNTVGRLWRHSRSSLSKTMAYLNGQRAMFGLLIYMLLQVALITLVSSMLTPLVLARHGSDTLGMVMGCGAFGAIGGAIAVTIANPKRRLMRWIILSDLLLAVAVAMAGFVEKPLLWALAAMAAMACGSVSNSCTLSLWMRKTPLDWRGSLFSLLASINLAAVSAMLLAGGVLVERVLAPAMMPGGGLADLLGGWLGIGQGRGVALLFVLCGIGSLAISVFALLGTNLAQLDDMVEDAPIGLSESVA